MLAGQVVGVLEQERRKGRLVAGDVEADHAHAVVELLLLADDLAQQDAGHVAAVVAHGDDDDARPEIGMLGPERGKALARGVDDLAGGQPGPAVDQRD